MTFDGSSAPNIHGRMWLSAATSGSIANATWSNFSGFNTDDGNSAGFTYSLGVVTFTVYGRVWFDLLARWDAGAGTRRGARLLFNGDAYKEVVEGKATTSEEVTSSCQDIFDVQPGDTVTMQGWQNSGASLSALGGTRHQTSFRIDRV
jgi:hypothetical protein